MVLQKFDKMETKAISLECNNPQNKKKITNDPLWMVDDHALLKEIRRDSKIKKIAKSLNQFIPIF
jgi:hypothetical protein